MPFSSSKERGVCPLKLPGLVWFGVAFTLVAMVVVAVLFYFVQPAPIPRTPNSGGEDTTPVPGTDEEMLGTDSNISSQLPGISLSPERPEGTVPVRRLPHAFLESELSLEAPMSVGITRFGVN